MPATELQFDQLRQTVDAIPVAVALYVGQAEGRTLFVNAKFVELFGYTQAAVADVEDWWRKAYPDSAYREALRNEWRRRMDRAAASGLPAPPMETYVTCNNGAVCNVEIHLTPTSNAFVVTFIDVSRRKRAKAILRDFQTRLDLALSTAKAAYWELDLAAGTHALSPSYYAVLGYSAEEAPRDRAGWLALLHPGDVDQLESCHRASAEDADDHLLEFRIRAHNGSWRWLLSQFRAVTVAGQPTRLFGIDSDITARKQAELALHQARDRAQQYLDIAGVIIAALTVEAKITLLNRRGCEVLGVSEAEVLGRDWFDVFASDAEREQQRSSYRAFVTGRLGPNQDIEMATLTGQGELRLITWRDALLRDETGAIVGVLSSGEDITERRAAERKRDEARTLIEATAEAFPDGLLVTDVDGRYLFWNNRLAAMWTLSESYLRLGQSSRSLSRELLKPYTEQLADAAPLLEQIDSVYAGSSPSPTYRDLLLKDGRIFASYTARVASGTPPLAAVAWICRDVTEERKRDAELAQSQRLLAVGELSGGVAHDFNNLLTIMGGNLELIQGEVGQGTLAADFAEAALSAVQRGAELTHRLLAFSRQQPLAPQVTDVNALISDVMETLPRLLGEAIEVRFVPGVDLWCTTVDPGQLQTALINLAANARDAMPNGGLLNIETANRVLDEGCADSFADVRPGRYLQIAFTDQGEGMPADVVKRAFEPFFTTKPVGKGTGLGLSMVFGFVKQSGGHVTLNSEQGRGTSITIYLPRTPVEPAPTEKEESVVSVERQKARVLLVEDEPAVSAVARALLQHLGCQVTEARNGPTALAILEGGEPVDLLFTDVMLPDGINGAQLAEAARALRPGLKVLMASGYSKEGLLPPGADSNTAVLQKPYRRNELAEVLAKLLDGSVPQP
ncbi:MAG: hypothetical protein QOK29_3524 [Rhodospirillaceae bacterium]|nr:hypothetical protein [Rhodospirillaceae bacterium]